MLSRYAQPSENFTEGYVRFVSSRTGIAPDEIVNTRAARDMIPIVAAMSQIENGAPAITSDVEAGWSLFSNV